MTLCQIGLSQTYYRSLVLFLSFYENLANEEPLNQELTFKFGQIVKLSDAFKPQFSLSIDMPAGILFVCLKVNVGRGGGGLRTPCIIWSHPSCQLWDLKHLLLWTVVVCTINHKFKLTMQVWAMQTPISKWWPSEISADCSFTDGCGRALCWNKLVIGI